MVSLMEMQFLTRIQNFEGNRRGATRREPPQVPGTQVPGTHAPGPQVPGTQIPGPQVPGTKREPRGNQEETKRILRANQEGDHLTTYHITFPNLLTLVSHACLLVRDRFGQIMGGVEQTKRETTVRKYPPP